MLSELDHPNIVSVIGKRLDSAPYFFVMPRYDCSLEDVLAEMPGDEDRLKRIFGAVLDGIEYAHSEGVLHRDLKPANILIRDGIDVAVSDFGLGRDLNSNSVRDTRTMQGSAAYAPPEQYRGAKYVDERADVFSLGRILYAMLTGETPAFQDVSKVPARFGIVITKCTRPDPDNRYQSIAALKAAWLATTRPAPSKSSPDKLRSLAAKLASQDEYDHDSLSELLSLLLGEQEDTDLVKDVVLELPVDAIELMLHRDRKSTLHLLMIFVGVVQNNSWPFSHTDVLARHCERIYDRTDDPELRARIISAVLEMGWSHNRWNVLETFGRLIRSPKLAGEEAHLYGELEKVSSSARRSGASYVGDAAIEPAVLSCFEFESSDEDDD